MPSLMQSLQRPGKRALRLCSNKIHALPYPALATSSLKIFDSYESDRVKLLPSLMCSRSNTHRRLLTRTDCPPRVRAINQH